MGFGIGGIDDGRAYAMRVERDGEGQADQPAAQNDDFTAFHRFLLAAAENTVIPVRWIGPDQWPGIGSIAAAASINGRSS